MVLAFIVYVAGLVIFVAVVGVMLWRATGPESFRTAAAMDKQARHNARTFTYLHGLDHPRPVRPMRRIEIIGRHRSEG